MEVSSRFSGDEKVVADFRILYSNSNTLFPKPSHFSLEKILVCEPGLLFRECAHWIFIYTETKDDGPLDLSRLNIS